MSFRFKTGHKKAGAAKLFSYASCVNFRPLCRIFFLGLFVLLLAAIPENAYAACTSPAGVAGNMGFNLTGTSDFEYCDGTSWVSMEVGDVGSGGVGTVMIDVGPYQSCALKSDNTAWCWGDGVNGGLGDGDTSAHTEPAPIRVGTSGTSTLWDDWQTISAGYRSSCGVRSDGTGWCWGDNNAGQVGNGNTTHQPVPVRVGTSGTSTLWSDWQTISAGQSRACGIRSDGSAWCWGSGMYGALGNGGTTDRTTPVRVGTSGSGTLWSDWVSINTGFYNTCGIRSDGSAWCWGYGGYGQLGDGTTTATQSTPVRVGTSGSGTLWSDWESMAPYGFMFGKNCGLRSNGTVWCWGYGTLGNGTESTGQLTPVQVGTSGGGTLWSDWVSLSSNGPVSCGVRSDGSAWCWGAGEIGNGTANQQYLEPARVGTSGSGTLWSDWESISSSTAGCGLRSNGTIWCWDEDKLFPEELGVIDTVSVTVQGSNSVKGSASSTLAVSGVTMAEGQSALVCVATLGNVSGVTWNGQAMNLDASHTSTAARTYIYSLDNVTAGTGDVIATISGTNTTALGALSVSGLLSTPLDKTATNTGTSNSPSTGTTATTAQAHELLFACFGHNTSSPEQSTWVDGFVSWAKSGTSGQSGSTNIAMGSAYRRVTATGTYAGQKEGASNNSLWAGAIATYKTEQRPAGGVFVLDGTSCSTAGEMYYDSTINNIVWCDGSLLKTTATSDGAGGAGCSTPTASAGALNYSGSAYSFCDGTSWVTIP